MKQPGGEWRFMRLRAEQLYEEGEVKRSLRIMRLINREQEARFASLAKKTQTESHHKIVSTH